MNSESHDPLRHDPADVLGGMLRDWRRRKDAAMDAGVLARRVAAAMAADTAIGSPAVLTWRVKRWRERAAWFAAGIAAAVAAVFVLYTSGRGDGARDWPPSVRFGTDQISGKASLVAGLEETFTGRLAWVAEHDQRVDVGLMPEAFRAGGTPVAVRIVVLSRSADAMSWRPVWQSDVIAHEDQVVDVAAGPSGSGRLRLWAHALPDGAIAIDGELSLSESSMSVRASYGGVQRPDEPRRVTGARDGGFEWQVIQTVVPLDTSRKEVG